MRGRAHATKTLYIYAVVAFVRYCNALQAGPGIVLFPPRADRDSLWIRRPKRATTKVQRVRQTIVLHEHILVLYKYIYIYIQHYYYFHYHYRTVSVTIVAAQHRDDCYVRTGNRKFMLQANAHQQYSPNQ